MSDDEEVGARARAARERLGLTQLDLTIKSQGALAPDLVSKLERGKLRWTVSRVREFARLLDTSTTELMGEDESTEAA